MNRILVILLFVVVGARVSAQERLPHASDSVEASSVCQNRWAAVVGGMAMADTYLSNQEYSGMVYGLDATHYGSYPAAPNVVWAFYDKWRFAPLLVNASYSAGISYLSGNVGYASYYRWRYRNGIRLLAGGYLDVFAAVKYQTRNVNNIASADIEAQLYASAAMAWGRRWGNFAFDVGYSLSTPIVGTFFAPEMGQSFYELYLNLPCGLSDVVHLSSFHNRLGLDGRFTADFAFRSFAFFLAFEHSSHWYAANNLMAYWGALNGSVGVRLSIGNLKNW